MPLTLILFMLMVAIFWCVFFFFYARGDNDLRGGVYVLVHAWKLTCIHVCPVTVTDLHGAVNQPAPPSPALPPPSPLTPPPSPLISLTARGDVIAWWWSTNQNERPPPPLFLLLSIGELKLVYFYDLFISLLPPPACIQGHQRGASPWLWARISGLHPESSRCGQISPQPIKIKPIVVVFK